MVAELAVTGPRAALDAESADANSIADQLSLIMGCGRIDEGACALAEARVFLMRHHVEELRRLVAELECDAQYANDMLDDFVSEHVAPLETVFRALEAC